MKYYVYIMSSIRRTLYVGVTSRIYERVAEHKAKTDPETFTAHYNVVRLAYFEWFDRVEYALSREKQLKGWRRSKKVALIESMNPDWIDLADPDEVEADFKRRLVSTRRRGD